MALGGIALAVVSIVHVVVCVGRCLKRDRSYKYSNWKPKLLFCTPSCSLNISVIYQPNWLKFGLQAHFLKMFGHTKFQLSISCTFKAIELLLEIT